MKPKFKLSRFTLIALMLYLFTFIMILPTSISAKYVDTSKNNPEQSVVADFVFLVEEESGSFANNVSAKIKSPNESAGYTFLIKNYDELQSEVSVEYTIKLEILGNMPIKCSLGKGNETLFTIDATGTIQNEYKGVMDIGQVEEEFVVSAWWPEDRTDISYYSQDAVGIILLTIEANQID